MQDRVHPSLPVHLNLNLYTTHVEVFLRTLNTYGTS
jgi:hypothetical protein